MVMSSLDYIIPTVDEIQAQLMTLDLPQPLTIGQELVLHSKCAHTTAKISKILKIFKGDKSKSKSPYINLT